MEDEDANRSIRAGIRASIPFAFVSLLLSATFGLVAEPVIGAHGAIAMSLVAYAGAAQFAVIAVLAAGGDAVAAVIAGVLLNARYVPMSLALAPSLPPGTLKRFGIALSLTDPGWALSARSGGRFDPHFLVGTILSQWPLWQIGTVIGVLAGSLVGDPESFGLDVILPAFFLSVLVGAELRRDFTGIAIAALGGFIALALLPIAPPGVPLIAASLAALAILAPPFRGKR